MNPAIPTCGSLRCGISHPGSFSFGQTWAILLGAGFILGRTTGSVWQPVVAGTLASFLGGICAFWLGHQLGNGGLERIRWLHLSQKSLEWPQRYFKRHGSKAVFLARLIAIFPPIGANLLAGMTTMSWRKFLIYNLAGSAVMSVGYILIGYWLGKNWTLLEGWLSHSDRSRVGCTVWSTRSRY